MDIFKIFALCVVAAFFGVIFLQQKKEYAMAISAAAACGVFLMVSAAVIDPLFSLFEDLRMQVDGHRYFLVALKAVALGYITQLTADTCRDFGFSSLASKAEFAGKAAIFLLCTPLIQDLFIVITEIL